VLPGHDEPTSHRHGSQSTNSPYDAAFSALGVIVNCVQNMGMGIRFTDVQLDQHQILEGWLAAQVR
jgi:hypothetical protein